MKLAVAAFVAFLSSWIALPATSMAGIAQSVSKAALKRVITKRPAQATMAIRKNGAHGQPAQVVISRSRYPETAAHISSAQKLGQPSVLTLNRAGARERRLASLRPINRRAGTPIAGRDRDEYPPAMTLEGGVNSSVRYVRAADNRGAGKSFEHQVRGLPEGTRVRVHVGD